MLAWKHVAAIRSTKTAPIRFVLRDIKLDLQDIDILSVCIIRLRSTYAGQREETDESHLRCFEPTHLLQGSARE